MTTETKDFNEGLTPGSQAAATELLRVAEIVRARAETHGDAIEQHEILGLLWSTYLDGAEAELMLSPADAAFMLLLLKVSRILTNGLAKEHVEDIAGYAAITVAALDAKGEK